MATLLKTSELHAMGWDAQLIKAILGQPDEKENIHKGIYHCVRHWYLQERVLEAMQSPAFLSSQEARRGRKEAHIRREEATFRKYPTWRAAVADACHGLHSLNRYCKHGTCAKTNREEIYLLKNQFVELLYRNGYCSGCWLHILNLPPKPCHACYGSGDNGECERCGGTGIYLPAKRLKFFCFRFNIGRGYTWHQPENLITFPVTTTETPTDWSGVDREKPLGMALSALTAAKHLIRWVVAQAKIPEPEYHFSESPILIREVDQGDLFA